MRVSVWFGKHQERDGWWFVHAGMDKTPVDGAIPISTRMSEWLRFQRGFEAIPYTMSWELS